MEITLRLHGQPHVARLVPVADGYTAAVDDVAHRVAVVSRVAAGPRAEELVLDIDGRLVRAVVARTRERVLVALGGRVYEFESGGGAGRSQTGGAGSGTVTAPMPGKIVSVLATVGQVVEVGAPLVVLEAMKMESTLTAEIAGRVLAVRVGAGALVAAGDVLVEIAA